VVEPIVPFTVHPSALPYEQTVQAPVAEPWTLGSLKRLQGPRNKGYQIWILTIASTQLPEAWLRLQERIRTHSKEPLFKLLAVRTVQLP